MANYTIEVETSGREVYQITALTEEEAKRILYNDCPKPVVSEVMSFDITSINEDKG
jgi:hypothetical protein